MKSIFGSDPLHLMTFLFDVLQRFASCLVIIPRLCSFELSLFHFKFVSHGSVILSPETQFKGIPP